MKKISRQGDKIDHCVFCFQFQVAYLTSVGFFFFKIYILTLNWKIKVKQVQKKERGYKVQQYKILPSFFFFGKSQVENWLL